MRSVAYDMCSCIPPTNKHLRKLKRNAYGAITRGHLRALGVAYDEAHEIGARLDIETGFQGEPGAIEAIDSFIEQFHFDNFLPAGHEIAVFIENGGGDGKIVAIASIDLSE